MSNIDKYSWSSEDLLRYHSGAMTPEEGRAFEAFAKEDPFFDKALLGFESLQEEPLADYIQDIKAKVLNDRPRSSNYLMLKIAAGFLILGLAFWMVQNQFSNPQSTAVIVQKQMDSVVHSDASGTLLEDKLPRTPQAQALKKDVPKPVASTKTKQQSPQRSKKDDGLYGKEKRTHKQSPKQSAPSLEPKANDEASAPKRSMHVLGANSPASNENARNDDAVNHPGAEVSTQSKFLDRRVITRASKASSRSDVVSDASAFGAPVDTAVLRRVQLYLQKEIKNSVSDNRLVRIYFKRMDGRIMNVRVDPHDPNLAVKIKKLLSIPTLWNPPYNVEGSFFIELPKH